MLAATNGVNEGLAIASGVFILAIVLAWRQWVERRDRETDLSEADQTYFTRKDVRRFWGIGLLVLIALGMVRGLTINPKANLATGQQFVWIWTGVLLLILIVLVLALLDWQANLSYARRHRREILEARKALIEDEIRLRAAESRDGREGLNGHAGLAE